MSVRDVEAGTLVDGRYRIRHRIGSGGMADVYCATDEQLGRSVALKVLHRRFAEDREFVERFRREASSAAALQHPNVVGVFDRGEWDGTSYIAMEHLEGRTLKQLITEHGALEPVSAIDLAVQVLRAARHGHKRGVIHRDLKPHNVIVDAEGRAKVTDFGIARAGVSDMTQTGSIMGTAQYLSPEQAQGMAVDERSDLYSVGISLYEMLTGRVPFDGESAVTIALKQVSEVPVPPSQLNPHVPPDLEAVVLRSLEKQPERRFQNADEFIAALEEVRARLVDQRPPAGATAAFAAAAVVEAPPEEEARRRWWPWALALVILVLGGLAAAYLLTRPAQVKVPSVVGQQVTQAQRVLRARGFEVAVQRQHAPKPVGQVFAQAPAVGTKADKGSTVTITVSTGPSLTKVPEVAGKPQDAAENALKKARFAVKVLRQSSPTVAQGIVISSDPSAGRQAKTGSTVTLTVSTGPRTATVLSVVGQAQSDAQSALQSAGFAVSVTQRDSSQPAGTVLSQSPAGGTTAPVGTTVTLVVARTPQVSVPNVVGKTESQAVNALSAAGFSPQTRTQTVTNPNQSNRVIRQNPAGGKAPKGSTVVLVVGALNSKNPNGNGGGTTQTTTTTTTSSGP